MIEHKLEVFQALSLKERNGHQQKIREAIIQHLTGGWQHAPDTEDALRQKLQGDQESIQILYTGPNLPECQLSLLGENQGYKLINIFPTENGQFSTSQYNQILQSFYEDVIEPAITGKAITAEISEPACTIDHWITPKAAKALKQFSAGANKSSGIAHPYDEKKWHEFIASAYRGGTTLTEQILQQWLKKDGWDEPHACMLASNYIDGVSLLSTDDRQRGVG